MSREQTNGPIKRRILTLHRPGCLLSFGQFGVRWHFTIFDLQCILAFFSFIESRLSIGLIFVLFEGNPSAVPISFLTNKGFLRFGMNWCLVDGRVRKATCLSRLLLHRMMSMEMKSSSVREAGRNLSAVTTLDLSGKCVFYHVA